ncbi:MarR family transcriptional regulator [Acidianus sp. RZ1]|uniref:MarR family transcriptional regulator n=1 Tax=Acidianus sp. RZ1 TaxID=1540082 RepID=UPI001490B661|nr:MarR family transcriptional regulator [Acidianus sp. RZ1]NON62956.1 MarR family transcriptional regulator [Acidianus sp. RZ1]
MSTRDKILQFLYDRVESTPEQIANGIRDEIDNTVLFLKGMQREGLVVEKEKGIIRKRKVYSLTPTGLEEAKRVKENVQRKAENIMRSIQSGKDPKELMEEYGDILPMLLMMSMVDAMLQDLILFDQL